VRSQIATSQEKMAKTKANIIKLTPDETIIRKIYFIRDQKVMLDFDLATLYDVETKRLNEQVKRNIDRFPEDFMFRLISKEWLSMRSQFATASEENTDSEPVEQSGSQIATLKRGEHSKYLPYAFTEHGVTMLASILKSERAVKMSIAVVRAFIELKKAATQYNKISEKLDMLKDRIGEHDVQLNSIYEAIENLLDDKTDKELKEEAWSKRKRIGFKSDA
jgi:phage regulator Rha-like protein